MAKRVQRGLGRGLGALLGDVVDEAPAQAAQPEAAPVPAAPAEPVDEVRMLPIRLIDPNRDQPRRAFDGPNDQQSLALKVIRQRPQRHQAFQRGLDVVVQRVDVHGGQAVRQRRGDQRPVGRRLGCRDPHGPGQ